MDFAISETVTQKTKELVERVLVEHWYNATASIVKQIRESQAGRGGNLGDLRADLSKLCLSLKLPDRIQVFGRILDKKTGFDGLVKIYADLTDHMHKEGVIRYESEKGYHSVVGDEMDYEQEIQD